MGAAPPRGNPVAKSVTDEAAYQLRRLLVERGLTAGDRLPSERELTLILNASRTSVRAALKQLEAAGILTVSSRRGAYVNGDSTASITSSIRSWFETRRLTLPQLIEFRRALEPAAAASAARRRSDEDLIDMAMQLETMTRAHVDNAPAAFSAADEAFHHRIALASRNPLFSGMLESVGEVIRAYREATARLGRPLLMRSLDDHNKIFEAIQAGDEERAAGEMLHHIVETAVDFHVVAAEDLK